ncbi:hypothetical protein OS493_027697 [Desmophyllum pertusum]|uniref:RRM domain-containing protein n=1 Tax=Desmophyllum pertusum TaxID=174260 RepID=A0A9W9ZA77_9CNID|nr:hypothetical protein OS493_027697 [Desmophyllum pertusum]
MGDIDIGKRIFVKGFSPETTENELRAYFERFGSVKESKVVRDRNGFSKGYAFITFESQEVADKVRDQDNLEFDGKSLNIGKAVRRKSKRNFGKYYYHRQDANEGSSHGSYYAFSTSDGSIFSADLHNNSCCGNSYMQPSPYSFPHGGHSWNEVAAVPMNAAVVPKVHHQFAAENPTEIAVSAHGQPAQIVSLAIPDGNYVQECGAGVGVGEGKVDKKVQAIKFLKKHEPSNPAGMTVTPTATIHVINGQVPSTQ